MITKFTLLAFFTVAFLSSCHRYYTSVSFAEKTARHKTIAILPPQLLFTGALPKDISLADIKEQEEVESRVIQEALYNNILKRANANKMEMYVNVQPYSNTLATLQNFNISVRDSWTKTDKEIASILGVDAVVRTSIQKDRYMSDVASAGIIVGKKVLEAVFTKPVSVPTVSNKTNDIKATCSIISNGEVLWNDSYTEETNYNYSANEAVQHITDTFAKRFPYKRKV